MEYVFGALITIILFLWRKNIMDGKKFEKEKLVYLDKIDKLESQISDIQQKLDIAVKQSNEYAYEIVGLNKKLREIQKELDFYKNIEEDSDSLNGKRNDEQHEQLLDKATKEILAVRNKNQNDPTCSTEDISAVKTLLDEEQLFACLEMERSRDNFFITGKAGTGKSFLLDVFRKTTTKKYVVLAPTGIAALNVNGATLHSTFGYYNLVNLSVDMISAETIHLKSEKKLLLKEVSTIIIDEISMVRADTLEKIDRMLKVLNKNNSPFGGKQMLFFGDLFQLPPVVRANENEYLADRFGGIYFFCADAYKKSNFRFLELTINHRQKGDADYFALLNRIREGNVTEGDLEILNGRVVHDESVYDRFTTLLPTKAEVERLNQQHLEQLNSPTFTYMAKIVLNLHPNQNVNLESIFPIANALCLKKGALVMMVANDPEHRWVNGTLGIVSEVSTDRIAVAINKRTYDIQRAEFTEQEITYINGQITYKDVFKVVQYPIVPAYAITIHKSQGQTYQNIVCDVDRCFANGQAYVALSRCESLDGLHLKCPINSTSIRVDRSVLEFYRRHLKNERKTFEQDKTDAVENASNWG